MRILIRLATADEIPLLTEVELSAETAFKIFKDYRSSGRTVPQKLLESMATDKKLWVAVDEQDKPVGFVGCENMDNILYIHEIDVAHSFQKQGIGRRLMLTVIDHAKQENYPAIGLTTSRDAAWNKPFYATLGFVEIVDDREYPDLYKQLQKEIGEGASASIRCAMVKRLSSCGG